MKVTRKQLYTIIRNQLLREYTEYFGSEFAEFKQRFDAGGDPEAVAKSMLNELGKGSTRIVYEFSDNPSVVLKIINTDIEPGEEEGVDVHGFTTAGKLASNQWEADLQMQQIYPDIFPRTFEVAPDYSWILAERVDPISKVELLSHVNLGDERFPGGFIGRLQFETVVTLAVDYFKKSPESDFVKNVLNEGTVVEPLADPTAVDPDYDDSLPTNFPLSSFDDTMALSKDERPGQNTRPVSSTLKRRLEKILSVPHVRRIFSAMAELDIPAREFSAKNLGISRISGKLTILDASLWKEHKKLR